jgi:hypothetical protein
MSPDDLSITIELDDTEITVVDETPEIEVTLDVTRAVNVEVSDEEVEVKVESDEVRLIFDDAIPDTDVIVATYPDVIVVASDSLGSQGPPGENGAPGPPGAASTVPGPPGPPGDQFTYIHNQVILSATWVVVHNRNAYPAVTVVDTGGSIVIPDIQYNSVNQLTIYFEAPTSGKAYLN